MILKFYRKVYFSDAEACQGLDLFPLCDDVMMFAMFIIECNDVTESMVTIRSPFCGYNTT